MKQFKFKPLLSDIQCTRTKFDAGDRILVRLSTNLTREEEQRVEKVVTKFAGVDVRILLVNCLDVKLLCKKANGEVLRLADASYAEYQETKIRVFNINCCKIDLEKGDQLIWDENRINDVEAYRFRKSGTKLTIGSGRVIYWLTKRLKAWAGDDVEVLVTKGIYE